MSCKMMATSTYYNIAEPLTGTRQEEIINFYLDDWRETH